MPTRSRQRAQWHRHFHGQMDDGLHCFSNDHLGNEPAVAWSRSKHGHPPFASKPLRLRHPARARSYVMCSRKITSMRSGWRARTASRPSFGVPSPASGHIQPCLSSDAANAASKTPAFVIAALLGHRLNRGIPQLPTTRRSCSPHTRSSPDPPSGHQPPSSAAGPRRSCAACGRGSPPAEPASVLQFTRDRSLIFSDSPSA